MVVCLVGCEEMSLDGFSEISIFVDMKSVKNQYLGDYFRL